MDGETIAYQPVMDRETIAYQPLARVIKGILLSARVVWSTVSRPTDLDKVTMPTPIAMLLITQATGWYSFFFARIKTAIHFF